MKICDTLPRAVRELRNVWIPLKSGERLAARVWLPEGCEAEPVPAILDFFVYRKSDAQAARDSTNFEYLAGHGYAGVKVDCRGTGDSDGIQTDQFSTQYVADALEVLTWIAKQSWCTGKVGMIGLSWPGNMALMAAARHPPELKAIVTMDAADDRYTNKYHGGCLLIYAFTISAALFGMHARPPHPEHAGANWRDIWKQRIEHTPLFLEKWLAHPHRDAYWETGTVIGHVDDIRCAVYMACGLSDPGYAVCVRRMFERLNVPSRALLGPWAHRMPQYPQPGPGVDFLGEILRWFDQWLKGVDTGITREPILRSWMLEPSPPDAAAQTLPGRWVAEPVWPACLMHARRYHITAAGLSEEAGADAVLEVSSPLTVGVCGGEWMPWYLAGPGPELAGDQREDDALSLCFDSAALDEAIEILGEPAVTLDVASDQPDAQIAVRLCAVAPDGVSRRLAFGLLDLRHRNGDTQPEPVQTHTRYRLVVGLTNTASAVPKGHRLRIAISTSYWLMVWPARAPVRLSVFAGRGALDLPLRAARSADAELRSLGEPTTARGIPVSWLRQPSVRRSFTRDLATGETVVTIDEDGGCSRLDDRAIEIDMVSRRVHSIMPHDPLSASAYAEWTWKLTFGETVTSTSASTRLRSSASAYEIEARIEAREGEQIVATRDIRHSVPRDPV